MAAEENITTRYRNASIRGKIDIILNYYPGFEEMLQGLKELLCINIEAEKNSGRDGSWGILASGSRNPGTQIRRQIQL